MTMYVYVAGRDRGPCKIGISKDPEKRARELQPGCPFPIVIFYQKPFSTYKDAWSAEEWFHYCHPDSRLVGEWFAVTPEDAIEFLELPEEETSP